MLKVTHVNGKADIVFVEDKPKFQSNPRQKAAQKLRDGAHTRAVSRAVKNTRAEQQNKQAKTTINKPNSRLTKTQDSKTVSGAVKTKKKPSATPPQEAQDASPKIPTDAVVLSRTELAQLLANVMTSQDLTNTDSGFLSSVINKEGVKTEAAPTASYSTAESHTQSLNKEMTSKQPDHQSNQASINPAATMAVPTARMETTESTQAEKLQRNAQWKKELDEQVEQRRLAKIQEKRKQRHIQDIPEDYSPWGKPGCGAPIRTNSGNVVADLRGKLQRDIVHGSPESNPAPSSTAAAAATPTVPPAGVQNISPNSQNNIPVAMRSSFAIGAPGMVSEAEEDKKQSQRQWLLELEMQIKEKKEREKRERMGEQNQKNTWADELEKYKSPRGNQTHNRQTPQAPQIQQSETSPQVPRGSTGGTNQHVEDNGSGMVLGVRESQEDKAFTRGRGMQSLDQQAQEEMDAKRRKMLEHQRAIQEQVEEKQRLKREERERRLRDERMEEEKLEKERLALQSQFELEVRKQKQKEEEAKRKSEALRQSVLEAYESAQQAKRDDRMKRLQAGGHDTSHLQRISETDSSQQDPLSTKPAVTQASLDDAHARCQELPGNTSRPSDSRVSYFSGYDYDEHARSTKLDYDAHSSFRVGEQPQAVPPLNLPRSDSPPVPAVRHKMTGKISSRSVDRTKGKNARSSVSSESTARQSTRREKTKSKVGHIATPSPRSPAPTTRSDEQEPPFDPVQGNFMVPYHRTASATLPPPSTHNEAPPENTKRTVKKGAKKPQPGRGVQPQDNMLPPIYRTKTEHLETENQTQAGKKQKLTSQSSTGHSTKQPKKTTKNTSKVSQSRKTENTATTVDHDAEDQHSATTVNHRDNADIQQNPWGRTRSLEESPTPRQEMILSQLASLREGLRMKQRELQEVGDV